MKNVGGFAWSSNNVPLASSSSNVSGIATLSHKTSINGTLGVTGNSNFNSF